MANKRADRVWLRLVEAYGSRVADAYGPKMPLSWVEAVDDFSDQQVEYGLKKCLRDTPQHPPTLGQFSAACLDMPQPKTHQGPTVQELLCAYMTRKHFDGMNPKQFALPWTYLYREWIDETRPKHSQKCAECVGVLIPAWDEHTPAYRVTVEQMKADTEGYAKALAEFQPKKGANRLQRENWLEAQARYIESKKILPEDEVDRV